MLEYKVTFNTFFVGPDPKAIQKDCDEMARDGWRLAAAAMHQQMAVLVWEREKRGSSAPGR